MTVSEAVEYYKTVSPRGEYVLIVEGNTQQADEAVTLEAAVLQAKELSDKGMRKSDAAKQVAKLTGFSKGDIYSALIASEE